MPDLFTDAVTRIEAAYSRLGHRHGWRFLATPRSTLNADATLAVVRLNPGGELVDPSHGVESCESGSAYVHEEWKPSSPGDSPLQLQV